MKYIQVKDNNYVEDAWHCMHPCVNEVNDDSLAMGGGATEMIFRVLGRNGSPRLGQPPYRTPGELNHLTEFFCTKCAPK